MLITYGDMVHRLDERPLVTLNRFLTKHLRRAVNTVHILPFFPYSSDDGFSITDYRRVNPELGAWDDIRAISKRFRLGADLVLNHVSRQSLWFRDYVGGIAPARHYFIEVDPTTDLSAVVRPRATPLLTSTQTRSGERHLWATFSEDQLDLNFPNPDVLFEFLDILFLYIAHGARIIRLDAIAYLWKEIGTSCIHLPQTHEVVKIFRDVLEMVAPDVILLTETNVPHEENVSYFGQGDEAQMVYQFSLPPLLLHALVAGNTAHLTEWAAHLAPPPPGCTFLNFTASHDGVGVRPLEGILPKKQFEQLLKHIDDVDGYVSKKSNPDGSETPYELNVTYFDALGYPDEDQEMQIARFMCSQTVPLALKGIPGIYFNSLVAGKNDYEGVQRTGRARSINRKKWPEDELQALLADSSSATNIVLREYVRLLRLRSRHAAFHPDGAQNVYDLGPHVFAVERTAPDGSETIVSISNFTPKRQVIALGKKVPSLRGSKQWKCLIRRSTVGGAEKKVRLGPYETCWLLADGARENDG
jgi:sucrose phosphorylase